MNQLIYYFREGGIFMWPLLLCSIIGVAVIIERAIRLRRAAVIDPGVVDDFQNKIEEGKVEQAIAIHEKCSSLVGRVLSKALNEYTSTAADIETSLTEAGTRGLQVLWKNLSVLTTVAKVSTLLGLLGTVQGMIMGFEELEKAGVGKEALAHAIRVALITTFAGLLIAIPMIIASAYFQSRIRRLVAEVEEVFIDIIKTVKRVHLAKTAAANGPGAAVAGGSSS